MKEKKTFILKRMIILSDPKLRKLLRTPDVNILLVICEFFYNVIRGHVKVQINNSMHYENVFRTVHRQNVLVEERRAIILKKPVLIWFVSKFILVNSF